MNLRFWRPKYYTPKELGLPFPEVARIYIGKCPGNKHFATLGWVRLDGINFYSWAHSHTCQDDENLGNICVARKQYIHDYDGSISSTMWHEYAHILDTNKYTCEDHRDWDYYTFQRNGHSRSFIISLLLLDQYDEAAKYQAQIYGLNPGKE